MATRPLRTRSHRPSRSHSPLFVEQISSSSSIASSPAPLRHHSTKAEEFSYNSFTSSSTSGSSSSSSSSTPLSSRVMHNQRIQAAIQRQSGIVPRRRRPVSSPSLTSDVDSSSDSLVEEATFRQPKRPRVEPRSASQFNSPAESSAVVTNPQPQVIDLTQGSSSPAPRSDREIQAAETLQALRSGPVSPTLPLSASGSGAYVGTRNHPILLDDEDAETSRWLRKVEARQEIARRQELFTSEQSKIEGDKPVSFNTVTCVICMEPPTNVTMTPCGHIFCHSCIIEAYKTAEAMRKESHMPRIPDRCPVCRKSTPGKKDALVPLLLMKGPPKTTQPPTR